MTMASEPKQFSRAEAAANYIAAQLKKDASIKEVICA